MSIIRSIRSNGLKLVRILLSYLIPVNSNKVIFQSLPDYSDNARAFSDYLLIHSDYNLVWSVSDPSKYQNSDRIKFIKTNGGNRIVDRLWFIYETVSSKYLISTHAAFLYANRRKQQFVCCWHGMPLKKIAVWQNPENKNYLNNTTYILSTSKYYIPILAKCFGRSDDVIAPTGYPRNDWLYKNTDVLERLDLKIKEGQKLIMYLPTYRKSRKGDTVDSDKDPFKTTIIDFTSEECLSRLNDFLRDKGVVMIVKPHPLESNQLSYRRYSNVIVVPHQYFIEKDIQLNKVLHYTDALITDFSGAYVDYLNLNRPIGFVVADMNDYETNRGFVFESTQKLMPGVKIYNEDDFLDFCDRVSRDVDEYAEKRVNALPIFSDYQDANNCRRLALMLKMKLND